MISSTSSARLPKFLLSALCLLAVAFVTSAQKPYPEPAAKDRTCWLFAYAKENTMILEMMGEAESIAARKATLLDPTEEDETIRVLRRRLFSSVDENKAAEVVEAYAHLWNEKRETLPMRTRSARLPSSSLPS